MRRTRHIDDPRTWSCSQNFRHDQIRKQEVADVVCPKLALNPIYSLCKRTSHDAGIVDQYVELVHALIDFGGGFSYGVQATQIKWYEICLDSWICGVYTFDDGLNLCQAATSKNDMRWRSSGKGLNGFGTYAPVTWTGYED